MRLLIVAVWAVIYCVAVASATLITFPADVSVLDGTAVQSICGDCCQEGSYCGSTAADTYIPKPSDHSMKLFVPKGTAMTCIMRARDVSGAVDGGLCVPVTFPLSGPLDDFCQVDKNVSSPHSLCIWSLLHTTGILTYMCLLQNHAPSFGLTEVIYQAGLKVQATDGPCCDGNFACDEFSKCRPTTGFKNPGKLVRLPTAVCVPSTASSDANSKYQLDMKNEVFCEKCNGLTPAATAAQSRQTSSSQFAAAPTQNMQV